MCSQRSPRSRMYCAQYIRLRGLQSDVLCVQFVFAVFFGCSGASVFSHVGCIEGCCFLYILISSIIFLTGFDMRMGFPPFRSFGLGEDVLQYVLTEN